jgi:Ser/Thr protein kinase RdoA (MazF antagonist)
LHDFATRWRLPALLTKRKLDRNGLFADDVGSGMAHAEVWALLEPRYRAAFEFVAERVRQVMDAWGEGPEVFGLIHADLGVDANVLFWRGEARAIDFDDSAHGYWAFDLAVALDTCWEDAAYPEYREALLRGYTVLRRLPTAQADELELFLAAIQVYWDLWAIGGVHLYPHLRDGLDEQIAFRAERVVRYACDAGATARCARRTARGGWLTGTCHWQPVHGASCAVGCR